MRRHIDLPPVGNRSAGIWDYRLRTDNEGRAILEAAIGALAAPRPNPDGTLDARPVGRRRGEALTEALRRSVIATSALCPSTSPKAVLMLTMGYDDATRPGRRGLRGRHLGHRCPDGAGHRPQIGV